MPEYFPRITVITPSLNQGQYIEETILSVTRQQYPDLEYLIFDGGSKDNTLTILQQYGGALTYWESTTDKGQSNAINKGLQQATGELVTWLNSDDFYEPDALHSVAKAYRQDGSCNSIIGRLSSFYPDGATRFADNPVYETGPKTAGYGALAQPAMFFSREAYQRIGLLNESLHYCMDLEWWLKYLLVYGVSQIQFTPELLVNFRHHSAAKTTSEEQKFAVERDSIYYSIATQAGMSKEADWIASRGHINAQYIFHLPVSWDQIKNEVQILIHYFIFSRGEEYYAQNERKKARICFKLVDPHKLLPADRKKRLNLIMRNTYMPLFLINLLRRL